MITMEDGTKIKTGMSFQTKTDGRKPFMVLGVHRDGTVSYAPEKLVDRWSGKLSAPGSMTVRVTRADFKDQFKKTVEDKFTRRDNKAQADMESRRAIEARNPDHARALWMDLLVRASRGEDTGVLFDDLEEKLKELAEEAEMETEARLERHEEYIDSMYIRYE